MRRDTMLAAAHSYNLSVVMVRPIPWYGFISGSSDAGIIPENELSCGPFSTGGPADLFVLQMPRTVPIGRKRLLLQAVDAFCECHRRLVFGNRFERGSE